MFEYDIPNHVDRTCKCGRVVSIEIDQYGSELCECGEMIFPRFGLGNENPLEKLLEIIGVHLSIDFDGQLIASSYEEIRHDVLAFLYHNQLPLRHKFERRRMKAQQMFVGGSLAGKPHTHGNVSAKHVVIERIGKAHWEVYESRDWADPRLYFMGRSTSEKNAKERKFVKG